MGIDARIPYYMEYIETMRCNEYAGHTIVDRVVDLINIRAAVVEMTWNRYNGEGEVFHVIRWVYFVVMTDLGWRIDACASRQNPAPVA
ncbi:hypothetical protein ACQPW1_11170 [Nocardia sp. CA-128927]|uniref:DUF6841 family protein n=1 Tax=Nocardia sp. CA-128927 TaxID=3239975 RepID=UPI003D98482F